jgi:hypothetical protein
VQDIVKQQLSGEDSRKTWNDKLLNEKWVFLFENMETDVPEQFADIYKICEYTECPRTGSPEKIGSLRANILTCILKKKSPISNDNREKTF